MRYFLLIHTDNIPEKFGGESYGPLIKIRPKYEGDQGLLEHEKVHVRQWYSVFVLGLMACSAMTLLVSASWWPLYCVAPLLHQLLYKYGRPYRRWCEVQAYRKQIATGGYASHEFAVIALVDNYDLKISCDKARDLLFH